MLSAEMSRWRMRRRKASRIARKRSFAAVRNWAAEGMYLSAQALGGDSKARWRRTTGIAGRSLEVLAGRFRKISECLVRGEPCAANAAMIFGAYARAGWRSAS